MKRWTPGVTGLALAAITYGVVDRLLTGRQGSELLAAILVAAGAIYVGAALAQGGRRLVRLESLVGIGFVAYALLTLWYSPKLLGAGYIAHGFWDLLHHPYRVGARAGKWFPPFCLAYDVAIGLSILIVPPF